MKKTIVFLTLFLLLSLSACGKAPGSASPTDGSADLTDTDIESGPSLQVVVENGKTSYTLIRPEYAVISYKLGNDYHHPAASALRRLFSCGATVYGTGRSGAVILTTDGTSLSFNTSNALTMADAGA